MPQVEVCLSPALLENFDLTDKIAVVTDIVRATTIVCAALESGIEHVLALPTKEETRQMKEKGYLIMGEKDGEKIDGFDLSNTPSYFRGKKLTGKKLAMSTTNGTKTIHMASVANCVAIGAFVNVDALLKWLVKQTKNVVIICSGWKNKTNIEDSLFAGYLANKLENEYGFEVGNDAVTLSKMLYSNSRDDMFGAVMNSSQKERIESLNLESEVHFCLEKNYTNVVPVLRDGVLVNINR